MRYYLQFLIFVLYLLFMMVSCNHNKTAFDVQGHRGCRGLMPENSLPAFKKAIDLGVTTLELDIAVTKDQQLIITHEPFVNPLICITHDGRTIPDSLDQAYNIYQMSYEAIKNFDCGSKKLQDFPNQKKLKTHKPLLKELFDLVHHLNADVKFNIELKSKPEYYGKYTPFPKPYVALVKNEIEASGFANKISLQSFDLAILEEVNQQIPNTTIVLLVDENASIAARLHQLSFKPDVISPYFKLLNKENISYYQGLNYEIIPWTVNKKEDMNQLISWGVNGIITDYPNLLLSLTNK